MKARITKRQFYDAGGFARTDQFRKALGTSWSYWRTLR